MPTSIVESVRFHGWIVAVLDANGKIWLLDDPFTGHYRPLAV